MNTFYNLMSVRNAEDLLHLFVSNELKRCITLLTSSTDSVAQFFF